jgi:hypothetical protein
VAQVQFVDAERAAEALQGRLSMRGHVEDASRSRPVRDTVEEPGLGCPEQAQRGRRL